MIPRALPAVATRGRAFAVAHLSHVTDLRLSPVVVLVERAAA